MKKTLFFSVLAVVLLSVGIGAILYANSQKSTHSTNTLSPELEPVFTYMDSPPEQRCVAYAYSYWDDYTMETKYIVTTSMIYEDLNESNPENPEYPEEYPTPPNIPEIPEHSTIYFTLVETLESEVLDCEECISRCSAYYQLCDKYGLEY